MSLQNRIHIRRCQIRLNWVPSVSPGILPSYPAILLAGDITVDDSLVARLHEALAQGSQVLLGSRHRQALGNRFNELARSGSVEVLEPWTNPATGRPAAISATAPAGGP
jgi:hypothetical protein